LRVSGRVQILLVAGLALTLACATRGRAFDPDSVAKIHPGSTTQEQVRQWFGEPVGIQVRSWGGIRWSYLHEEKTRRDTGSITKIGRSIASILGSRVYWPPVDVAYENHTRHSLEVIFDPDGIVQDYTYERKDVPTRRVY
jgi:outer membrane protein assembly factor BamE (lipoprotein component of BamABCDE complex)